MSCARRTCQVASRPDLAADWAILWAPALCWERPMGSIDTCCSAAIVSDVVDVVSAKTSPSTVSTLLLSSTWRGFLPACTCRTPARIM